MSTPLEEARRANRCQVRTVEKEPKQCIRHAGHATQHLTRGGRYF